MLTKFSGQILKSALYPQNLPELPLEMVQNKQRFSTYNIIMPVTKIFWYIKYTYFKRD